MERPLYTVTISFETDLNTPDETAIQLWRRCFEAAMNTDGVELNNVRLVEIREIVQLP